MFINTLKKNSAKIKKHREVHFKNEYSEIVKEYINPIRLTTKKPIPKYKYKTEFEVLVFIILIINVFNF